MSLRLLSTGPGLGITHDPQTVHPAESLGIIRTESRDHLSKVWGSFGQVWGSWVIPHQTKITKPLITNHTPNHRACVANSTHHRAGTRSDRRNPRISNWDSNEERPNG